MNSTVIVVTDADITGATSDVDSCEICAAYYGNINNRNGHLQSERHRKNLIRRQNENQMIANLNTSGTRYLHCVPCLLVTTSEALYNDHLTSQMHIGRTNRFTRYWSNLERQARRSGASSQGSAIVDFGIIDLQNTGNIFTRSVTIKNDSASIISLTNISSRSSPSLYGIDTNLPITITPTQSFGFNFTFTELNQTPRHSIENISMNFTTRTVNNQIPFIKRTTCTVIIGDEALLRSLVPTEPYSRRKRGPDKFRNRRVMLGEMPPLIQRVEYVNYVGENKIPEDLLQMFSKSFTEQEQLPQFANLKLTPQNYANFFSTLLHAEENQMNKDIHDFDIDNTTVDLSNGGRAYFLTVQGLAEKRPSVLYGDKVELVASGNPNSKKWIGFAHNIEENRVILNFHRDFPWIHGSKWDVRFSFSRIPFRRMHDAVKNIGITLDENWARKMFPSREGDEDRENKNELIERTFRELRIADRKIQHNEEQCRAVSLILSEVHGDIPFIVFGPPGTGKTSTIIESIYQLIRRHSASKKYIRILATAPSNAAADLICFKLSQYFGPTEMIRFNAPTRVVELAYPDVANYCSLDPVSRRFEVPKLDRLVPFKIIVSTCGAAGTLYAMGGDTLKFTHIFIDEAGHALEPEAMLALQMAEKDCRIILSGDPRQLGPIVRSPLAKKLGFNISYLERLVNSADSIPNGRGCYSVSDNATTFSDFYGVLLKKNYRSHPTILEIPNRLFYRNQLIPSADRIVTASLLNHPILPNKKFPILFQQVPGQEEREGNSPSWFNKVEVNVVKKLVETILEQRGSLKVNPQEIGVIAPYRKQMKKIMSALGRDDINVGTTELFQGAERKVIIISTVRSRKEMISFDKKHALGFIGDPKRFNVAMTRSQALLCVVGDARVLKIDEHWREWLKYVREHGGWQGDSVAIEENIEEYGVDEATTGMGNLNVEDESEAVGGNILAE